VPVRTQPFPAAKSSKWIGFPKVRREQRIVVSASRVLQFPSPDLRDADSLVARKTTHRESINRATCLLASPSEHLDERLIAIEEIVGDELHRGSWGSVVEARDDDIGGFIKSGASWPLLRRLPFNLQNRRPFRDISNYRTGMLVASGLLTGLKGNLANINGGYLPLGKSCFQKWLAENRTFHHANLMSRNA
jgi:hypothetical protein